MEKSQSINMIMQCAAKQNLAPEHFTEFESGFVTDFTARLEKWGDTLFLSYKQQKIVERIYEQRVVKNQKPAQKSEA